MLSVQVQVAEVFTMQESSRRQYSTLQGDQLPAAASCRGSGLSRGQVGPCESLFFPLYGIFSITGSPQCKNLKKSKKNNKKNK